MTIETFYSGWCWRNRVVGGEEYPDEYPTFGLAVDAAASEAQEHGAVHVVRARDGSILEQMDYSDFSAG